MKLEPWHLPVLVMAGIIILELPLKWLLSRWGVNPWVRPTALGLLAVLVFVAVVKQFGTSLTDSVVSFAGLIAAVASVYLAYRASPRSRDKEAASASTGEQPGQPSP